VSFVPFNFLIQENYDVKREEKIKVEKHLTLSKLFRFFSAVFRRSSAGKTQPKQQFFHTRGDSEASL
jgi:hypothetical protein